MKIISTDLKNGTALIENENGNEWTVYLTKKDIKNLKKAQKEI